MYVFVHIVQVYFSYKLSRCLAITGKFYINYLCIYKLWSNKHFVFCSNICNTTDISRKLLILTIYLCFIQSCFKWLRSVQFHFTCGSIGQNIQLEMCQLYQQLQRIIFVYCFIIMWNWKRCVNNTSTSNHCGVRSFICTVTDILLYVGSIKQQMNWNRAELIHLKHICSIHS